MSLVAGVAALVVGLDRLDEAGEQRQFSEHLRVVQADPQPQQHPLGGHRVGQYFDGDVSIETFVVGPVDDPHSALADLFGDAVVAQGTTDEVLHCPVIRSPF